MLAFMAMRAAEKLPGALHFLHDEQLRRLERLLWLEAEVLIEARTPDMGPSGLVRNQCACMGCWLDDMNSGRELYFRRSWTAPIHTICPSHSLPLVDCSRMLTQAERVEYVRHHQSNVADLPEITWQFVSQLKKIQGRWQAILARGGDAETDAAFRLMGSLSTVTNWYWHTCSVVFLSSFPAEIRPFLFGSELIPKWGGEAYGKRPLEAPIDEVEAVTGRRYLLFKTAWMFWFFETDQMRHRRVFDMYLGLMGERAFKEALLVVLDGRFAAFRRHLGDELLIGQLH